MFDILPNLLACVLLDPPNSPPSSPSSPRRSSVLSTLFPVFASYKALRSSDPAQLAPWLMYWVTFALVSLADAWISPVAGWVVPLYAWLRLVLLAWLVLPQTQGARWLYQTRVHPFLARHERLFDRWLAEAVRRARAAGAQYVEDAIAYVKKVAFGIEPPPPRGPPPSTAEAYSSALFARFTLPGARDEGRAAAAAPPGGEVLGMLGSGVSKSRSEASFERIDREEAKDNGRDGGGWLGWAAGAAGAALGGGGQGTQGHDQRKGGGHGFSSGADPR